MHFINSILPALEHFHGLGYWALFLVSFIESLAFIGFLVPGTALVLLLISFLVSQEIMNIPLLIGFAAAGAILGDSVSFYLGAKGGRFFKTKGRGLKKEFLEKGRRFLNRHGNKSILLARFIGPLRPIIPFAAGFLKMDAGEFLFWNISSGIFWAIIFVSLGFFFGQTWRVIEAWGSRAGIFLIVLFLLFFFLYLLKKLFTEKGKSLLIAFGIFCSSMIQSVTASPFAHSLIARYPGFFDFLKHRLDSKKFSGKPITLASLVFIGFLFLFWGATAQSASIVATDIRLANLFLAFRTPFLTNIFLWITFLGSAYALISFAFSFSLILWIRNRARFILPLWLTLLGSEMTALFLKSTLNNLQPIINKHWQDFFSFSFVHTTGTIAFYGFITYLLVRRTTRQEWKTKINFLFGGSIFVFLVGISRLYLGAYFFTDILGGYLLGILWLVIGIMLAEWSRWKHPLPSLRRLRPIAMAIITLFLITLPVAGIFSIAYRYNPSLVFPPAPIYETIRLPSPDVTLAIFDIYQLPRTVENITGRPREALNFIIVTSQKEDLIHIFKQAGWNEAEPVGFGSLFHMTSAVLFNKTYPTAPLSPSFWNNRIHELGFEKPTPANTVRQRHRVRLWNSGLTTQDGKTIYVGSAGLDFGARWGLLHSILPDIDAERESLMKDLVATQMIQNFQKKALTLPFRARTFLGGPFFTDGKLYLVELGALLPTHAFLQGG
ncbi:LssY C-terminal domain-containing protein [Candidatus Peregrinibacteria bacterium]|nr:LssY C-terminal domain-containing protein [Candidatus Peregrinibacteria bacterium]